MMSDRDHTPDRASTPGDGTSHGEGTREPVAWAYEASDGKIIAASPSHKQIEWDVERWNCMVRDGRQAGEAKCVPLYRSPTLTGAEREAVEQAIDAGYGMEDAEPWALETLRELLKRLG